MALVVDGFFKFINIGEFQKDKVTFGAEARKSFDSINNPKAILAVWYFVQGISPVVYKLKEVTRENFAEFLKD